MFLVFAGENLPAYLAPGPLLGVDTQLGAVARFAGGLDPLTRAYLRSAAQHAVVWPFVAVGAEDALGVKFRIPVSVQHLVLGHLHPYVKKGRVGRGGCARLGLTGDLRLWRCDDGNTHLCLSHRACALSCLQHGVRVYA